MSNTGNTITTMFQAFMKVPTKPRVLEDVADVKIAELVRSPRLLEALLGGSW